MLVFQSDGNLVLTHAGKPVWSTRTNGTAAERATIQADNNFVVGLPVGLTGLIAPLWSTETNMTARELEATGTAYAVFLQVQNGGTLALYVGSKLLWSSTKGKQDYYLEGIKIEDDVLAVIRKQTAIYNAKWADEHRSWLANVARAAGHALESAVHAVADLSSSIADKLGSIPLIGPGLKGLYDYSYGAMFSTIDSVASGTRIDKALSRHFEAEIAAIKEVAPYVQTVIAFVPGIGPGISAGISAGLSLAQGHTLDQALVDAAVGAIPGGPLVQAATKLAISAARGDNVGDSLIVAIPGLPPAAQQACKAALHVVSDIAAGKPVDQSLLNEADKQLDSLPPEFRKAAQVGIALGQGKRAQDIMAQQVPGLVGEGGPLAAAGQALAKVDAVVEHGRGLAEGAQHGFDVGAGLMRHKLALTEITAARNSLSPNDMKGFDMACALHTARVIVPKPPFAMPKSTPGYFAIPGTQIAAQTAGYFMIQGISGAPVANKVAIAKMIVADPAAQKGAGTGLVAVTNARVAEVNAQKSIFTVIHDFLFGAAINVNAPPSIQLAQATAALKKA